MASHRRPEAGMDNQDGSQPLIVILKTWLLIVAAMVCIWILEVLCHVLKGTATSREGNSENEASAQSNDADHISDSTRSGSTIQNNAEWAAEHEVARMFLALDPTAQEIICHNLAILEDPATIAIMILESARLGGAQKSAKSGDQESQADSSLNEMKTGSTGSKKNKIYRASVYQPSDAAVEYTDKACQTDPSAVRECKVDKQQNDKKSMVAQVIDSIFKAPAAIKIHANVENAPVYETKTPSSSSECLSLETLHMDKASVDETRACPLSQKCLFFDMLPAEMRNRIYRNVLKAAKPIDNAAALVKETASDLVTTDKALSGAYNIDAKLLQTCRRIYTEALSVLYSENTFHFNKRSELETFRDEGLYQGQPQGFSFKITPYFNLEPNPNGRVALIRNLSLKLGLPAGQTFHGFRREAIIGEWRPFIRQHRNDPFMRHDSFEFPLLENLELDFSDWELQGHERLVTCPFIEKFRGPVGLRKVVIKGVSHEKSLEQLKDLLKEGGEFISIPDN